MFKAPIITVDGQRQGEMDLPTALFDGVVHEPVIWQAVKAYQANQRRANAAARSRGMVRGGSRKPWRQKGTGRARQGTIRAPHWRGGGVVFGPSPERNHRQALPKKVRWLARRSAYNARARDGGVLVVESLDLEKPRTKAILELLDNSGAEGKILLLTDGQKPIVQLSARNLPGVRVQAFGHETTYDVLWAGTVIIESSALDRAAEVAHA